MGLLFLGLLWSGTVSEATAQQPSVSDREAARQQQQLWADLARERQRQALVRSFLSDIDDTRVGLGPDRLLREFLSDVREFSAEVRGLYMLRYAPMTSSWAQEDLRNGTREVESRLEDIRQYVAFGASADPADPSLIPSEDFYSRLNRLYAAAAELITPLFEVTEGDVLDLDLLTQVREQLALIRQLSQALGETEF